MEFREVGRKRREENIPGKTKGKERGRKHRCIGSIRVCIEQEWEFIKRNILKAIENTIRARKQEIHRPWNYRRKMEKGKRLRIP